MTPQMIKAVTPNEAAFLVLVNDPDQRPVLLARLAQLGLLSAFLQAESGTK